MHMQLERIRVLDLAVLAPLLKASQKEGYHFLARLHADWESGSNRFDKSNEGLYFIKENADVIAIGGVNNNPYHEVGLTGRLRHIYVMPDHRRKGIGKKLVSKLIELHPAYEVFTLRTDTSSAAEFYESIGFMKIISKNSTHSLVRR